MSEEKLRDPLVIAKEFNSTTRALITRIEKKTRNVMTLANLDRANKRISLLKSTMGDMALINEAHPFFIDYANHILEPVESVREDFFLTLDIKGEYIKAKGFVKKEDEFIFALTDAIRELYKVASRTDKDDVYRMVNTMLQCCIEYKIILSFDI